MCQYWLVYFLNCFERSLSIPKMFSALTRAKGLTVSVGRWYNLHVDLFEKVVFCGV